MLDEVVPFVPLIFTLGVDIFVVAISVVAVESRTMRTSHE